MEPAPSRTRVLVRPRRSLVRRFSDRVSRLNDDTPRRGRGDAAYDRRRRATPDRIRWCTCEYARVYRNPNKNSVARDFIRQNNCTTVVSVLLSRPYISFIHPIPICHSSRILFLARYFWFAVKIVCFLAIVSRTYHVRSYTFTYSPAIVTDVIDIHVGCTYSFIHSLHSFIAEYLLFLPMAAYSRVPPLSLIMS